MNTHSQPHRFPDDPTADSSRQDQRAACAAGRAGRLLPLAVVLLCLSTLTTARGGEISRTVESDVADVTATISKPAVQVAELLVLELKVVAQAATNVLFPSLHEKLGEFDVVGHQDMLDIPIGDDGNRRMWIRRMTLESIVTGDLEIPAMELQIVAGDKAQTLATDPLTVQVLSVLEGRADPTQFRDIQSVVDVEVPAPASYVWLWWTLGGIGASVLAGAGALLIAKRKTWMTPNAWALRELEQLQSSAAVKDGDSDTVCQQVSVILRDYLELQYDIPAPRQTTHELVQMIGAVGDISPDRMVRFRRLFKMSDEVRFAGFILTRDQLVSLIDDAKTLMEDAIDSGATQPSNTPK